MSLVRVWVDTVSGGIEAVAIKNLQTILRSRGISAEALFSKYDLDDNGNLNLSEFEGALTSITGQKAPGAIVNAIFSVLDSDGNGVIDLQEILTLVDSGPSESYIVGNSLTVSDHPNEFYNGTYTPNGEMNGKPLFMNSNGARMYFYNAGSGGASSWSLDDREQGGNQDYYRGGWTRPPANGELPLGTRRWVGVGRITIEMNSSEPVDQSTEQGILSDTEPPTDTAENDQSYEAPEIEVVENDDPSVLMGDVSEDFTTILSNLEASEFSTLESLQRAREIADNEAESKISKLPALFQNPARELWKAKADSFQLIATSRIPSNTDVALGLSAAAFGAVAASSMADNEAQTPVIEETRPKMQQEETVIEETLDDASSREFPREESGPGNDTIHTIIQSFSSARMLTEQNSLNEKFSGTPLTVQVRVISVERSFGIGIDDKYRGGNTIIASLITPQSGSFPAEVEIRMPSDRDTSSYKPGHEGGISCMFDGWNSIRKRVILNAQ
jgi:hypothetical protein